MIEDLLSEIHAERVSFHSRPSSIATAEPWENDDGGEVTDADGRKIIWAEDEILATETNPDAEFVAQDGGFRDRLTKQFKVPAAAAAHLREGQPITGSEIYGKIARIRPTPARAFLLITVRSYED